MELEDKLEEVFDEFDFKKVRKVMEKLEWKWSFPEEGMRVPKISEMKRNCRRLFFNALESISKSGAEESTISSGGFSVTVYAKSGVVVQFVLEERRSDEI